MHISARAADRSCDQWKGVLADGIDAHEATRMDAVAPIKHHDSLRSQAVFDSMAIEKTSQKRVLALTMCNILEQLHFKLNKTALA